MAINLDRPLAWTNASEEERVMLADLQGNILDGHGRKSTRHLFLQFGKDQDAARSFLSRLEPQITSALKQLTDARRFRETGISGGPFTGLLLSQKGYEALGIGGKAPVDDGAFTAGMRARADLLNDPADDVLDPPYLEDIHAMILIGADPDGPNSWDSSQAENAETAILNLMQNAASVIHTEIGRAIFKDNGTSEDGTHKIEGIEHFGYVDGRSQPLLLQELIDREAVESDGINIWDPTFPLRQVLVKDPGSDQPNTAFGSFFVFRKLEQNVKGFKTREEELGDDPALGKQGELMGAMLVGRFEDGTPVVMQRDDGVDNPVPNNFTYEGDTEGLRCPFHAHIRKTNPRGDSARAFGIPLEQERAHIMARRGMTYGRRNAVIDPTDGPDHAVGLMFMSFQSDLANQFEFTQKSWANNPDFVKGGTGLDPIIGQSADGSPAKLIVRDKWGRRDAKEVPITFESFVTFKGGEYFFAPAKSTLAGL